MQDKGQKLTKVSINGKAEEILFKHMIFHERLQSGKHMQITPVLF